MQLSSLAAAWRGAPAELRLTGLAPGLNVIYGPNGSGKTSLMRFARELFRDGCRGRISANARRASCGSMELWTRMGPVRLVRQLRSGHRDSVALIAPSAACIDQLRRGPALMEDELAGLHFVELTGPQHATELAALAARVTERLCAQELGADFPCVPIGSLVDADTVVDPAAIRLLCELAPPDDDCPAAPRPSYDRNRLAAVEANWRLAITSLRCQRERLMLAIESRMRQAVRRQREWHTRCRWLRERAATLTAQIEQWDADWQAAASDLREVEERLWRQPCGTPAPVEVPVLALQPRPTVSIDCRIELLRQVLEDLARERMQVSLALAASPPAAREWFELERGRIDGCEQEVFRQMDRLQRLHEQSAGGSGAAPCPACGHPLSAVVPAAPAPEGDALGHRREELAGCAAQLQQRLRDGRAELAQTWRQIARIEAARRIAGDDTAIDQLRFSLAELDRQIVELEERCARELSAAALEVRFEVMRRHDVMRRAGAHLARLTAGRYTALGEDRGSGTLLAHGDGAATPLGALSRGTAEQVVLSLRVALLEALGELGESYPAVWDEPLADSDEQRLAAAAALLADYSRAGAQLILLTCREHVAQQFALHGAIVHHIGHAELPRLRAADWPRSGTASAASLPIADAQTAAPADSELLVRVHPGGRLWLQPDSALEQVPSLGLQMARRLRALGVDDVRDLIEFDLGVRAAELPEVQIDPAQVLVWQAEARLLTQVPDLTGRDAQLLVSCGVFTPLELAAADVDELTHRIDRLRGGDTLRWRPGPSTAPHRETIERWIAAARRQPPTAPETSSGAQARSRRRRRRQSSARSNRRSASLPARPPVVASRFRLHPDSPVTEAPLLGLRTARRLQRAGVTTVRDLLACDAQQTAARLQHRRITAETIETWRRQASLMCSVPELRHVDAVALVACGITGPLDLQRISAEALIAVLKPYLETAGGRRLLRGETPPTPEDVSRWIATVEASRVRRAA